MTERDIQLAIIAHWRPSLAVAAPNYTPRRWWECDIWGVTKAGRVVEWEIKLSMSDLRADTKKARGLGRKHDVITTDRHAPSRFWYVVPAELGVTVDHIPEWAGLAWARTWTGGEHRGAVTIWIAKQAPELGKLKVERRELVLVQRRMWYRYWECVRAMNERGIPVPKQVEE